MAANYVNLTDSLEQWRVKANEVYGKVGNLTDLTKNATVQYTGIVGQNQNDFTGNHATFTVRRVAGSYEVDIQLGGSGYDVNDIVLVDGSLLGGSSGVNDATITITSVDPGFAATGATISGTAVGDLISEVNALRTELGSLLNFSLNTDNNTFYEAVNEIEAVLRDGGLGTYALNTDAQDLVAAINEIETALRGANVDYALDTDANDLVSAVNEFQSEIGSIEDFDAQGTSSDSRVTYVNLGDTVVSAINSLKDKTDFNSDQIGGTMVDDYDGTSTNIIDALNVVYNASSVPTLDAQYVRADGSRGMDQGTKLNIASGGIDSGNENFLIKSNNTTRLTISQSTGNIGINKTPGVYKVDVNGTINSTRLSYDGQDTDLRYARATVNPDGTKSIFDDTVYEGGSTLYMYGSIVTEGDVVIQRQEGDDNDYNFLEWTQDQVGNMVTGNIEERGISAVYDDATGKINFAIANNSHNHTVGNITNFTEEVQDTVGGMVSGNTENGIAVTYNDTSGKLNFDVNDPVITISGEASGSATMTNLGNTNIAVTLDSEAIQDRMYSIFTNGSHTGISAAYDDANNRLNLALTSDITLSLSGDVSGSVQFVDLGSGTYDMVTTIDDDSHNHTTSNIDNFTEEVQDIVGTMINPTNIEAGLNVTYDDETGKINFDVNDFTYTLGSGDISGNWTTTNLGSVSNISLTVNNSSITTAKIADNAITKAKMADDSVGSAELDSVQTFSIYNVSGTEIFKMYGAGS